MPRIKTTLTTVYCVRHGESTENDDGTRRGELSELTDLGKRQAEAAAKRMKALGIDALVTSTAERALGTAQAIAAATGLPIEANDLFVERRRPSATLGRHTDDHMVRRIHQRADILGMLLDERQFDEDTFKDLVSSVREGFTLLQGHTAKRICLVTHNTRLRMMDTYVFRRGSVSHFDFDDAYWTLDFDNGGITCFRYGDAWKKPDKFLWQRKFANDISHLDGIN